MKCSTGGDFGSCRDARDPELCANCDKTETDRIRCEAGGPLPLEITQGENENESANPFTKPDGLCSYPVCGYEDHKMRCTMLLREMGLEKTFFVDVATDRTIQIDFDFPFDLGMTTQFYETLDIFRRMLDSSKEEVAPVIPILPYESKTKNVL